MKKDYMAKLERAARWRLPPQEAKEVVSDYLDMFGTPPRSEEELYREVGDPEQVVKLLVSPPRAYRIWLAVFAVMAACILLPADSPLPGGLYPLWFNLFYTDIPGFTFCRLFLIAGLALSLVWFRPGQGEAKAPLPRSMIITLAALLAAMALVWWTFWQVTLYPEGALANPVFHLPMGFWWPLGGGYIGGNLLSFLLEWGAIPLAVVGMTGLVKARLRDRRWRAVYFLSLSVLMLAFAVLALLTSMDVTSEPDIWWASTRRLCIEITVFGLIGTGVSLC